jgi:hypothetical protein
LIVSSTDDTVGWIAKQNYLVLDWLCYGSFQRQMIKSSFCGIFRLKLPWASQLQIHSPIGAHGELTVLRIDPYTRPENWPIHSSWELTHTLVLIVKMQTLNLKFGFKSIKLDMFVFTHNILYPRWEGTFASPKTQQVRSLKNTLWAWAM